MTHQHAEAKIISLKKRETLTEPHYMFCGTLGFRGTPVQEYWSTPGLAVFTSILREVTFTGCWMIPGQ